jgi:hypothetical protein
MLSADEVRRLLDYDPTTGILTWRERQNLKPKARSWNARNAGKPITVIDNKGYICVQIYKKKYRAHRIAWLHFYGAWPELDLDHINGLKTDNRIANLREATVAQNGHNVALTSRNSSGVRGVFWHKGAGKWQAGICFEGREIYLGLFASLEDAKAVRERAEKTYYGEFARAA